MENHRRRQADQRLAGVDLTDTIETLRRHAEAIDKLYDQVSPTPRDVISMIVREPIGVVGTVLPWNFPLFVAMWRSRPRSTFANWPVGDPLKKETRIGALIEDAHLRKVLSYIEIGKQEDANIVLGGHRILEKSGGYLVEPTVFDGVTNKTRIAREEIFGPVLSVITLQGRRRGREERRRHELRPCRIDLHE
jgi:acyl-CoA reductase-like NAD-dependent aldehyde dehydrogenase